MISYDVGNVGSACVKTMEKLEFSANNLANASTPGFKAELLSYIMTDSGQLSEEGIPSYLESRTTDYSQGTLQRTDNPLDIALQGEGFFAVMTQNGIAYTRKGDFTLNAKNELVTKSGDAIMGRSGKIVLEDRNVQIDESGTIKNGENQAGQLKIVAFKNPQVLIRAGEGILRDPGTAILQDESATKVMNGSLELSNVNVVKEMIQMVDLQRTFETYQKMIQAIDEQDKLSSERIGKVA